MGLGSDCPVVVLASGQTLRVRQVMLYEEESVVEIAQLRAQAAKGLGSTGVGLGVLGTPSLQFAAEAVAVGVVSGLIANAVQKTALDTLRKANEKQSELSRRGQFFPTSEIESADIPNPGAWVGKAAAIDRVVDVYHLGRADRDAFLQLHNKTKRDVEGSRVRISVRPRFVYNGDDFINLMTDVGLMSVRWSSVVAYFPAQEAEWKAN
jgi:hypothetical protein